jgi:dolichol-phosphate mannosyltransferase
MPEVELTIGLCGYKEAENLRVLLPQIVRVAETLTADVDVLVIGPQATVDNSEAACAEHGARYVRRSGGDTYADAVRTLLIEARGRYLLHMDADGSHRPADISLLWSERHRYDVVIGSRYVDEAESKNPLLLRLQSRLLNACLRQTTGLALRDFSNSFRLYRTSEVRLLQLRSKHFEVLQEILVLLREQHPQLKIGEVPIVFEERLHGQSKRKLMQFLLSSTQMQLGLFLRPARKRQDTQN